MSERDKKREMLFEQFGNEQLPDEIKHEMESDDDLKREWEGLQKIKAALPDDFAFAVSDTELDSLCAAVDEKIDTVNVTSIKRNRILSPTWQRTIALAATLTLVIIGSLLFNQYQPQEDQTVATADNDIYSSLMITDDNVELSDPMYNVLLMNYTSGATAEPASMLLDDLTEAEMEYLKKNFDIDELML